MRTSAQGRGGDDKASMTTVGVDGNSFKEAHRMSQKVRLNVTLEWGRIPGEFALFCWVPKRYSRFCSIAHFPLFHQGNMLR